MADGDADQNEQTRTPDELMNAGKAITDGPTLKSYLTNMSDDNVAQMGHATPTLEPQTPLEKAVFHEGMIREIKSGWHPGLNDKVGYYQNQRNQAIKDATSQSDTSAQDASNASDDAKSIAQQVLSK